MIVIRRSQAQRLRAANALGLTGAFLPATIPSEEGETGYAKPMAQAMRH
jgi:hypothetical protein